MMIFLYIIHVVRQVNNIFLNLDALYSKFNQDLDTCTIKNQEKTILYFKLKENSNSKICKEFINQLQELFSEDLIKIIPKEKIIKIERE